MNSRIWEQVKIMTMRNHVSMTSLNFHVEPNLKNIYACINNTQIKIHIEKMTINKVILLILCHPMKIIKVDILNVYSPYLKMNNCVRLFINSDQSDRSSSSKRMQVSLVVKTVADIVWLKFTNDRMLISIYFS